MPLIDSFDTYQPKITAADPKLGFEYGVWLGSCAALFYDRDLHRPAVRFGNEKAYVEFAVNGKQDVNGSKEDHQIEFPLGDDGLVRFLVEPDRVKEEIELNSAPPGDRVVLDFVCKDLVWQKDGGVVNFKDDDGKHVFSFEEPRAFDSNGREAPVEIALEDGSLLMIIPKDFCANAVFPITIDPTILTTMASSCLGYACQRPTVQIPNGQMLAGIDTGPDTIFKRRIGGAWSQSCALSGPNGDGTLGNQSVALLADSNDVHIVKGEEVVVSQKLRYIKATHDGVDDWTLGAQMTDIVNIGLYAPETPSICRQGLSGTYFAACTVAGTVRTFQSNSPALSWSEITPQISGENACALLANGASVFLFTTKTSAGSIRVRQWSGSAWSAPYDIVTGLPTAVGEHFSVLSQQGTYHLLYRYRDAAAPLAQIRHKVSTNPTSLWSDHLVVAESAVSGAELDSPSLSIGASGHIVAVWSAKGAATARSIQAAQLDGSAWTDPLVIAPGGGDSGAEVRRHSRLPARIYDPSVDTCLYMKGAIGPYQVWARDFAFGSKVGYSWAARQSVGLKPKRR
jgi:hypothetical protein